MLEAIAECVNNKTLIHSGCSMFLNKMTLLTHRAEGYITNELNAGARLEMFPYIKKYVQFCDSSD